MRAGLLMAVLLLAACTGASPSLAPTPEPVRKLADGLSIDFFGEPFSVSAATSRTEFDELWTRIGDSAPGGAADQPPVDFEREIVIYLGMAGSSSCPEQFSQLVVDVDAGTVYGSWLNTSGGGACTDDLQSQGVLLAVSRAVLPQGSFVLSLRAQPVCADCSEHPDQLIVNL